MLVQVVQNQVSMEKLRERIEEENRKRSQVARHLRKAMKTSSPEAQAAVGNRKRAEALLKDPSVAREVEEGFAALQGSPELTAEASVWLGVRDFPSL